MTSANSARWKLSAFAASVVLCAASTEAQTGAAVPSQKGISCLDTVSLKPSKQMLVYLGGTVADSTDPTFAEMGDQFTQSVSQHMRTLLHSSGSALPRAEAPITWRHVTSHSALRVTVHREGAPTFTLLGGSPATPVDALLLKAAMEAQAAGDGTYWPGTTPGDSAEYTINIALPSLGQIFPIQPMRAMFPTFSILFPPFTPPIPTSTSAPADPFAGSNTRASAVVVTDFEVDTTGHVVPPTISEVWPPGKERPSGQALETYSAFLNSVIRWLPTATFQPGRIGGCPVSQLVQLPITFGVAR